MPGLLIPFTFPSSFPCSYMPPFFICSKCNFLVIPKTFSLKFGLKWKHFLYSCILPHPLCIFVFHQLWSRTFTHILQLLCLMITFLKVLRGFLLMNRLDDLSAWLYIPFSTEEQIVLMASSNPACLPKIIRHHPQKPVSWLSLPDFKLVYDRWWLPYRISLKH